VTPPLTLVLAPAAGGAASSLGSASAGAASRTKNGSSSLHGPPLPERSPARNRRISPSLARGATKAGDEAPARRHALYAPGLADAGGQVAQLREVLGFGRRDCRRPRAGGRDAALEEAARVSAALCRRQRPSPSAASTSACRRHRPLGRGGSGDLAQAQEQGRPAASAAACWPRPSQGAGELDDRLTPPRNGEGDHAELEGAHCHARSPLHRATRGPPLRPGVEQGQSLMWMSRWGWGGRYCSP
jgi:hypothetical protein